MRSKWLRVCSVLVLGVSGCQTALTIDAAPSDRDAAIDAGVRVDAGELDAALFSPGASVADTVVVGEVLAGPYGDPMRAINGVRGAGATSGGLDVYSIPYGGQLVLRWTGQRVLNGEGIDVVVFENAFGFGASATFMDLVVVEVSLDGVTYVPLPYDYVAPDETVYSSTAAHWLGFAGVTPVLLNEDDGDAVDPFDPLLAGGDGFDLDTLSTEGEAGRIRREGFVFLRLTPAPDHTNPDTGVAFVRYAVSNGPDIDGVYARYVGDAP